MRTKSWPGHSQRILWRRVTETVAKPDKAASENWLRPEGPVVNSPARKGGGLARPLVRGPKARHTNCAAPSALHFISYANHALTGVAIFFRAFGPANARASHRLQNAQISKPRKASRAQTLSACLSRLILAIVRPSFATASTDPSPHNSGKLKHQLGS